MKIHIRRAQKTESKQKNLRADDIQRDFSLTLIHHYGPTNETDQLNEIGTKLTNQPDTTNVHFGPSKEHTLDKIKVKTWYTGSTKEDGIAQDHKIKLV